VAVVGWVAALSGAPLRVVLLEQPEAEAQLEQSVFITYYRTHDFV
jgi:hypothetical protein